MIDSGFFVSGLFWVVRWVSCRSLCGMEGGCAENKEGWGCFLYICFIDRQAREKRHTPASPQDQDRQEKNKKKTGLEQTAHESDVWLSLLFTSFAVACPFNVQHSAISWLYSLAPLCGVLPGRSCPGSRPPLQALCVCVWMHARVCECMCEWKRERERWGYAQN